MKKLVFLAAFMAGCICLTEGCGSTGKTEDPLVEEALANETVSAVPEAAEEVFKVPQIITGSKSLERYNEDGSQWLLHGEYDTVALSGTGYEALAERIDQWMEEKETSFQSLADEYAGWAEEDEAYEDTDYYRYSFFQEIEAVRIDTQAVSLLETRSDYAGGAHGNYSLNGYTWDAKSGKLLDIEDILKDAGGFREASVNFIMRYLEAEYPEALFPDYGQTVEDIWMRDEGPDWYLDAAGITFIFNPYEIGPYAMGEIRITLPYEEFSSYIKEEYTGLPDIGMAMLPKGQEISLGLEDKICFYQEILDDYAGGPVFVEFNGTEVGVGTFERTGNAYLLKIEDRRKFVILDADYASDDFVTVVYEIADGTLQERDRVDGLSLQKGSVNTETLKLYMHLDVIGTYRGAMDYQIGEDGKLLQQKEWFEIADTTSPWKVMVTKKELPVQIEDEEIILPVGSRIYITATDNAGRALFRDEDTGTEGVIHYTHGDTPDDMWVIYINGIPDYDYFEMIPYAG